jgi:hypothetical protein
MGKNSPGFASGLLLFGPTRAAGSTRCDIFGRPLARPVQKPFELTSFGRAEVSQDVVLGLLDSHFRAFEQGPALAGQLRGQCAA